MTESMEYKIDFWDHVINADKLTLCRVYGKIIQISKDFIVLSFWEPLKEDDATTKSNRECLTILKKAIIKAVKI
jgi:hypothetical protein